MKRCDVNPNEADPSVTSTELLRQAQANDQVAWEQLVNQYSRRMYRWCRRAGLQQADAGNVVQESLEAVARRLGDFRRDRSGDTFRGWLRRITDNKIRDHFRRQGRKLDLPTGGTDGYRRLLDLENEPRLDDATPESASSDQATWDTSLVDALSPASGTMQQEIERVRNEVSERDWKFFWRVVVDGQSAAEVGREFGVTANTVRLVKMRLLRRLRRSFDESNQSSIDR
ncbi:MAG: RNA polymerase sigma factor [Planctomycetota bacterium]